MHNADKSSALINSYLRAFAIVLCLFLLTEVGSVSVDFPYQARLTNTDPQQAVKYSLNKTQCQQLKEEEYAE